jgi:hypothetical protein
MEIANRASFEVDFKVPAASWRRNLEDRERPTARGLAYRTAVFRANAVVRCTFPVEAKAEEANYTYVSDDSFFVAGFASGE